MKVRHTALLLALAAGSVSAAETTVPAATSLKKAFVNTAIKYEERYPQSKVKLNATNSGALLQQTLQGAPMGVLAFANQETMDQAQIKGVINKATRKSFALNSLVTATPKDSKLTIGRLGDLKGYRFDHITIGNPASVPVGRYSKTALEKAGVWDNIRSEVITTQNVHQSLSYVACGEVDAGFVYNTDAILMKDKVKVLETVPTQEPVSYPVTVAASSPQKVEAKRFVQCMLSVQGQDVSNKHGLKKP